jgi:hypothetical protein
MLRKLRIAFSATCGIVCLLLVVLWVRSYRWSDDAYCPLSSSNILIVNSWRGRLSTYVGEPGAYPSGWGTVSRYVTNIVGRNQSRSSWGYASDQQGQEIMFPHWLLVFTSAALAAALISHRPHRFSLCTLLIATTIVSVLLGVVVYAVR